MVRVLIQGSAYPVLKLGSHTHVSPIDDPPTFMAKLPMKLFDVICIRVQSLGFGCLQEKQGRLECAKGLLPVEDRVRPWSFALGPLSCGNIQYVGGEHCFSQLSESVGSKHTEIAIWQRATSQHLIDTRQLVCRRFHFLAWMVTELCLVCTIHACHF